MAPILMDPSAYRQTTVSRGFKYNYYFSLPLSPTHAFIVFVHGFPSTSYDWHKQVTFFQAKGYGLIVPDMLGHGETSKPTDLEFYSNGLAKDLIDILDAEGVKQAVFVGHDWGSRTVSRVLSLFPGRICAAAFLSAGYIAPNPNTDLASEETLKKTKELLGYEIFGYFSFFSGEDGSKSCMDNLEAFFNIIYPDDPKTWITDMAPTGAMRESLLSGKILPSASWLSPKERSHQIDILRSGSLEASTCYYKASVSGRHRSDDQEIPLSNYDITQPVLFCEALEDYICISSFFKPDIEKYCKNRTYREFKSNHWIMLQMPEEFNRELLGWLEGLN
ncbi:hypothetical protein VKT23_004903 [Stygiomarasmius scandens]|uniref:AB hydrolase-1 domain-containing protein n=1 Tax=Marasmiellus scandens TaxID=2682957 RepID=A0ABR1JRP9_9AGAR